MSFYWGDTKITVTFSFLLVVSVLLFMDTLGIGWLLLLSVILHELGHLAAMRLFHIPLEAVGLYPFGIQIRRGGGQVGYGQDVIVYLSGCAASLLLALVFGLLGKPLWSAVNLALGLFNLLPVLPLDGGQAVKAFCRSRTTEAAARRISLALAIAALFPLAGAALLLLGAGGNFSLILTVLFLAGGLFNSQQ